MLHSGVVLPLSELVTVSDELTARPDRVGFVRNVLMRLCDVLPGCMLLQCAFLAFEGAVSLAAGDAGAHERAVSIARNLLGASDANRTSLLLFMTYAQLEIAHGKLDEAGRVFEAALAASKDLPPAAALDGPRLSFAYAAHLLWGPGVPAADDAAAHAAVVHVLCCLTEGAYVSPSKMAAKLTGKKSKLAADAVPPTRVVKARSEFARRLEVELARMDGVMAAMCGGPAPAPAPAEAPLFAPEMAADVSEPQRRLSPLCFYAACYMLFEYCSAGVDAAVRVVEAASNAFAVALDRVGAAAAAAGAGAAPLPPRGAPSVAAALPPPPPFELGADASLFRPRAADVASERRVATPFHPGTREGLLQDACALCAEWLRHVECQLLRRHAERQPSPAAAVRRQVEATLVQFPANRGALAAYVLSNENSLVAMRVRAVCSALTALPECPGDVWLAVLQVRPVHARVFVCVCVGGGGRVCYLDGVRVLASSVVEPPPRARRRRRQHLHDDVAAARACGSHTGGAGEGDRAARGPWRGCGGGGGRGGGRERDRRAGRDAPPAAPV
jgi:hypothetical protein